MSCDQVLRLRRPPPASTPIPREYRRGRIDASGPDLDGPPPACESKEHRSRDRKGAGKVPYTSPAPLRSRLGSESFWRGAPELNDPTRRPADEDLPRIARLRAKLALIPDIISGISLDALKDAVLPAWADGDPAAPVDAPDERIAAALSAARASHDRGDADGAAELLVSAAREARSRPERTFLALWLLEVAERWSSGGTCERLHCQIKARLGGLTAQVGDVREGMELLRAASGRLFDLAEAVPDRDALLAEAWWWKYEAVAWGLRTGAVRPAGGRRGAEGDPGPADRAEQRGVVSRRPGTPRRRRRAGQAHGQRPEDRTASAARQGTPAGGRLRSSDGPRPSGARGRPPLRQQPLPAHPFPRGI